MIKPVAVLDLPYPPSVNHYYGRNKFGGVRIKGAGKKFRYDVAMIAKQSLKGHKILTGPLHVSILMYPPDRRKRDVDNILKALFDSLQHAKIYKDDSQIINMNIAKEQVVKGGGVNVIISTLGES